jgi:predicted oxidoreductase
MTYLPESSPIRDLYKGGPSVSSIAWGMWRFRGSDVNAAQDRVQAALDAGVTLFDTADIYGPDNGEPFGASELLFGAVLKRAPALANQIVIATKGGIIPGVPYNSSQDYLTSAIDASLTRMGVEHVALWQIHRPDILTHPTEIARALEAAHEAGKIGAVGVSNHTPAQVEGLSAHLRLPVVSTQPEFSPLTVAPLSDGVLDQAIARNMTVLAWSPLGGGRLAQPRSDREHAVAAALTEVAQTWGVSLAAAAYSWIMAHPARPIPIVGTQTPARIAEIPEAYRPRWTRAAWYNVLVAALEAPLP